MVGMAPAVLTIAQFWNDTGRTVVMNRVTASRVYGPVRGKHKLDMLPD
jgi:hypothetical protein